MPPPIRDLRRIAGPRGVIEVFVRGEYRCMRFAGGGGLLQGRMHLTRPLDFGAPYHRDICAAALAAARPRRALCLGLGVGALPRLLRAHWPGMHVDAVEIDPTVIAVARDHFDLRPGRGLTVVEADAVDVVRRAGPLYDVLALDCYDGAALPAPLTEPGFLADALARTAPDGVFVANVIPSRAGAGALSTWLARGLRGPMVISTPGRSNRVWFGGREEPPDPAAMRARAAALSASGLPSLGAALDRIRVVGG